MTNPTSRAAQDVSNTGSTLSANPVAADDSCASDAHQLPLLIQGCQFSLYQCDQLLNQISQESFVTTVGNVTVGAHFRHVLDRFQCFLQGLPEGMVDYDGRRRDQAIATNLEAAGFALASIIKRMATLACEAGSNPAISVRESVYYQAPAVTIASSMQRELMGLISHTTHHLAIIALLAKDMGYTLDKDFGKAPSTIQFERGTA